MTMRSIRLSLLVYFLGLVMLVLLTGVAVSALVNRRRAVCVSGR